MSVTVSLQCPSHRSWSPIKNSGEFALKDPTTIKCGHCRDLWDFYEVYLMLKKKLEKK